MDRAAHTAEPSHKWAVGRIEAGRIEEAAVVVVASFVVVGTDLEEGGLQKPRECHILGSTFRFPFQIHMNYR